MDWHKYDVSDVILCEVCGKVAVDIHHIEPRSLGGNPKGDKDNIMNLIALCRPCHHEADFGTGLSKEYLRQIVHDNREKQRGKTS